MELPAVCRRPEGSDPLEAPRLVPSAVHMLESPGLLDRIGTWRPIARRFFLGHTAVIGRQALEHVAELELLVERLGVRDGQLSVLVRLPGGFDEETRERFVPHVVEPSAGVDRSVLAFLSEAYAEHC